MISSRLVTDKDLRLRLLYGYLRIRADARSVGISTISEHVRICTEDLRLSYISQQNQRDQMRSAILQRADLLTRRKFAFKRIY